MLTLHSIRCAGCWVAGSKVDAKSAVNEHNRTTSQRGRSDFGRSWQPFNTEEAHGSGHSFSLLGPVFCQCLRKSNHTLIDIAPQAMFLTSQSH